MPEQKPRISIHIEPMAYNAETAARVCGVGVSTFDGWIDQGLLFVVVGNGDQRTHKIFLRSDLESWLRSRHQSKNSKGIK